MTQRVLTITRTVKAPVARCFEVFTAGVDGWWRRGPRFRRWHDSVVSFEGQRLWERHADEAALVATVTSWQPPHHLALDLGGERVEVAFAAEGEHTRVTVRHHRDDDLTHFQDAKGLWWSDQLVAWGRALAA